MYRLPHENYIRFLITTGLDYEGTIEHLSDLGLPTCDLDYWDNQFTLLMESPIPGKIKRFWKDPKPPFPNGFMDYMNVISLQEAWRYNIGKHPEFKYVIEHLIPEEDIGIAIRSLLALKSHPEELTALVNGKFTIGCLKAHIEIYSKYFFNIKVLNGESWSRYLSSLDGEEKRLIYLGKTRQENVLKSELGLPFRVSVSENIQRIHLMAMDKLNGLLSTRGPNTDKEVLRWAQLVMSSGKEYEKLKVNDASDLGRDIQMEFEHIDSEFPLIGASDLEEIKSNLNQNKD